MPAPDIFGDWHAEMLADLALKGAMNELPVEPLGFGEDLYCTDDVTQDWALTDPQSPESVSCAIIRRLITARGELVTDPDYGCGLPQRLNKGYTLAQLQDIQRDVVQECNKDDRVLSVDVKVTFQDGELTVDVKGITRDPNGSFALILVLDETGKMQILGAA